MAITRQIVFGVDLQSLASGASRDAISPIINTYSWAAIPDQNASSKSISCAFSPRSKGTAINPLQETVLLGTVGGSLMMQAFKNNLAMDNASNSTGTLITNRIDPTRDKDTPADWKRFCVLEFPGINPFPLGLTVQYCKNVENPLSDAVTWLPVTSTTNNSRASFNNGLAQWIHLKFIDTTASALQGVFDGFRIHYYNLGHRVSN